MRPRVDWSIWLLAPLLALVGCDHNPYGIGPILAGVVRLDASLADGAGVPTGTRTVTTATNVRVWLTDGARVTQGRPRRTG